MKALPYLTLIALIMPLPFAVMLRNRLRADEARVAHLEQQLNSLRKDSHAWFGASSEDDATMRKEATEHEVKEDRARQIADDAIKSCWSDGNVAVDGLDTFYGGRVVCIRPSGVVFVAEPHWPQDGD